MNDFPPPPPPKLGFLSWLRIAFVLFVAGVVAVVALFLSSMFLIFGLVIAAIFSVWATFKLRRSTIKGHYEAHHVRRSAGRQVIRGDYLEVLESQELEQDGKKAKKGRKPKVSKAKDKGAKTRK